MNIDLDWSKLYSGHINHNETLRVVQDEHWQNIRKSMKGKSLKDKYNILTDYVNEQKALLKSAVISEKEFEEAKIRVTNYITALSRGGLIKPSDYKRE